MRDPQDSADHPFGSRGEGWVAAQLLLMSLVAVGPRVLPPSPWIGVWGHRAGIALLAIGVACAVLGATALGPNLTPFPRPRRRGALVTSGAYAVVRHPIYTAVVAMSFGWGLMGQSVPTLAAALALLVLFDLKSRREERWLVEQFPDYRAYQRRVRKLIPFVY